jgi:hypothetical protein
MRRQTISSTREAGGMADKITVGDYVECRGMPYKGAVGTVFRVKRVKIAPWVKSYGVDLDGAHTLTGARRIYTSGVRKIDRA